MVSYVNASRRVYLSTTIIQGRLIARIAILNLRTTAEIIEEVVDAIRTFVLQRPVRELESSVNHDCHRLLPAECETEPLPGEGANFERIGSIIPFGTVSPHFTGRISGLAFIAGNGW